MAYPADYFLVGIISGIRHPLFSLYTKNDYSSDEGGIAWNCPLLNIAWPLQDVQLSEKDSNYLGLKDLDA
ncbi:MAG: dTDP-4-dehydrorhamnose 3,5-epimerase family protein [Pseudomonas sp.]|nr:dTDP-4-dehydrorhamnose 3,5-epimerase family protein [Pseudomonas sp.]